MVDIDGGTNWKNKRTVNSGLHVVVTTSIPRNRHKCGASSGNDEAFMMLEVS